MVGPGTSVISALRVFQSGGDSVSGLGDGTHQGQDRQLWIYGKNYGKITSIYKDQNLTNELGIVIGAITGSQELINYAASEKEGGQFNMCTALDELIESGKEKLLTEMVEKKLAKNKTPDTIADELETDISIINNIIEKIEKSA